MGETRVIEALLAEEARGDVAAARALVAELGADPDLLVRVDVNVRSYRWLGTSHQSRGPAGLVLAAADADGRVRQWAVRQMAGDPGLFAPFLALRTADWVRQVRDAARGSVAVLLHDDPARLPAVAAVADRIRHWGRGSFLLGQLPATRLLWERGDRSRLAFELAERHLTVAELVEVAETDPNRFVRGRAAELAAREILWNTRVRYLTRLAESRHTEVRAVAVTGLVRAGRVDDAVGFLGDRSALVRALARDAARRVGVDPLARYRQDLPDQGAIDGLFDIGDESDAPALTALLTHETARVRATALRALRRIGVLPDTGELLALLTDLSARVVREAVRALRRGRVPEDRLWTLLDHERAVVRRGVYRLLRATPSGPRAAERLRTDPDPRLSRMVDADLRTRT